MTDITQTTAATKIKFADSDIGSTHLVSIQQKLARYKIGEESDAVNGFGHILKVAGKSAHDVDPNDMDEQTAVAKKLDFIAHMLIQRARDAQAAAAAIGKRRALEREGAAASAGAPKRPKDNATASGGKDRATGSVAAPPSGGEGGAGGAAGGGDKADEDIPELASDDDEDEDGERPRMAPPLQNISLTAAAENMADSVARIMAAKKEEDALLAGANLDVRMYTPELLEHFRQARALLSGIEAFAAACSQVLTPVLDKPADEFLVAPLSSMGRVTPRPVIDHMFGLHRLARLVVESTNRIQRIFLLGNHTTACNWETVEQLLFRERADKSRAAFDINLVPLSSWEDKVKAAIIACKRDREGLTKDNKALVGPLCPTQQLRAKTGAPRGGGQAKGGNGARGFGRGGHNNWGTPKASQGNGGRDWGTPKPGRGAGRSGGGRGGGRGGSANKENPRQNNADRGTSADSAKAGSP